MNNRWSPEARTAALAVRQAKALQRGRPVPGAKPKPKKALSMKKPADVFAGGSSTFDERTGKSVQAPVTRTPSSPRGDLGRVYPGGTAGFDERTGTKVPEINVWIPPPSDPLWKDPKFVESFKKGIAKRTGATPMTKPNVFWSSTNPNGPGQGGTAGITRWDPKNPDLAEKLGYPGTKKSPATTRSPTRVVIAGKRYTRVGGRLVPDAR